MLASIWSFVQAHPTTFALIAYYVASAFIGSLPAPQVNSGMFYQFVFKFLNTLGGNLARAFSTQLPVAAAQAQGVVQAQAVKAVADEKAAAAVPVVVIPPKQSS